MIDLFGAPPSAGQIDEWRKSAADQGKVKFEDSMGAKVALFTPIPGLDFIAGLAAFAVEDAMRPDLTAPFQYVPGSTSRAWPSGSIAEAYTAKVSAQGRDLIRAEVAVLEQAANLEAMTKVVADSSVRHFSTAVGDAFKGSPLGSLFDTNKAK